MVLSSSTRVYSFPVESFLKNRILKLLIGGPGGSGVDLILAAAKSLHTVVGDSFDLIGFDPRGVQLFNLMISWHWFLTLIYRRWPDDADNADLSLLHRSWYTIYTG